MAMSQRLAYLFRRYLEHSCTPEEKEELFGLLQQAEHDDALRRLIAETWDEDLPAVPQSKTRADAILRQIVEQGNTKPPRFLHLTRWAAAIFGVIILSSAIFYFIRRSPHPATPSIALQPPPADQCITLPDGSKVLLHKTARLEYKQGFSNSLREVTLQGEAYFDIHSDPRPFIVHTGAIRTTVLGTAFNINTDNEHKIVITVTRGKVKVENGHGQYSILQRNEQLAVADTSTRLQKLQVDATKSLTWKKTYLLFNDVPMREAMDELAQRYHLTVVYSNPAAASCPVTASFISGESLDQMINVLSKINNMEYTIDHGRVTIMGDGCK
jgi:ferric-dicitrate binding protein FerR (iron transport regulator)